MKKFYLSKELIRRLVLYEKDILQRANFHLNKGLKKLKMAVDFDYKNGWQVSYEPSIEL